MEDLRAHPALPYIRALLLLQTVGVKKRKIKEQQRKEKNMSKVMSVCVRALVTFLGFPEGSITE